MSDTSEVIDERAVGSLDGVPVAVANIWERDYETGAGASISTRRGPTAWLAIGPSPEEVALGGEPRIEVVGAGSVVEVAGSPWEVVAVEPAPRARGRVRLRRLA